MSAVRRRWTRRSQRLWQWRRQRRQVRPQWRAPWSIVSAMQQCCRVREGHSFACVQELALLRLVIEVETDPERCC